MPAAVRTCEFDPPDRSMAGVMPPWNITNVLNPRRRGRLVVVRLLLIDPRKVSLAIFVDLEGGKELRIVVLAGEAETRPVPLAEDLGVIASSGSPNRLEHPAGPVIVGGYRQRPITQQVVIMKQQLGRGFGGFYRIKAVVVPSIDVHVLFAGGSGELPQARGATLGTGI